MNQKANTIVKILLQLNIIVLFKLTSIELINDKKEHFIIKNSSIKKIILNSYNKSSDNKYPLL